ncbi:hypothetical protein N657DRAFT_561713 [Parathielavia appendiculata]|uniref:Uncharacterized protein n=1 Tax=Parathielavia appendiculata TaxID=2587402 RepID=A0AAN6U9Q9_9PEZI|nr:hypothetical protein N657DRAFT_561713 [Parathielavia appendiculata]
MLLEKPSTLSKNLNLDKGYQFGPAVQLVPGYFTHRPGKQAHLQQDVCLQPQVQDILSRSAKQTGSSQAAFRSLGGTPTENATISNLRSAVSSGRLRTNPSPSSCGSSHESTNKHDGETTTRKLPLTIEHVPFPDASPKQSAKPTFPVPKARNQHEAPALPTDVETLSEVLTVARTNNSASAPEPRTSQPTVQCYADNANRHHESPNYDQRAPLAASEREERSHRQHRSSTPQVVSACHSVREYGEQSRSHMARPVRDMGRRPAQADYRARPESRSSNISKQSRSRCGSLASSPMLRQRRVNISHEFTTGLAGVINQFTQQQSAALEEQKAKYHKYIKRLRRELAEESAIVAQQNSQMNAQIKAIEELQHTKELVTSQLNGMEAKLAASEDRSRRLEEKYRACKAHLNSAIQEQQDLYTRSKQQWTEALEQINALTQQVDEKEAELSREREAVRVLSEQLKQLKASSSGFETLGIQGKEILQRLEEQQVKADEERQKSAQEFRDRLDSLVNRLEALSSMMSGQPDVLSGIQAAQDESLRSMTTKLNTALESGDATLQATNQLSADLEHHMGKVWERLGNQLESLGKQLAEKAEENGMVSTLYKRKDAECERHMKELTALRVTVEKQADQIHELETNLVALDAAQDENEETIRRLEAAGAEAAQAREELDSKTAALQELQSKLDAKERAYASELQNYSSNMQKLAQAIQDKDRNSGAAAKEAAETARREVRVELERVNAETEKRLQETRQQRDSLAEELQKLKQQVDEKKQNEARDAATIRSLWENLAVEEAKGKLAAEKLAEDSANSKQVESQLSSKAQNLEAELEAFKSRAAELEEESQRRLARIKALVAGLKQWADQEGIVIGDLDCFSDESKSPEQIVAGLVQILGCLPPARRSETITPEKRSGDLLLRGENSRFFLSSQQSQSDLEDRKHGDQSAKSSISATGSEHSGSEETLTKNALGNDPLSYASTLRHMRRVVVRSPANVPNEPAAPSVDQEKQRRREALQPKSIMKRVTRSTSNQLKQEVLDTGAGHGAFKRSRHNGTPFGSSAAKPRTDKPASEKTNSASETQATESTNGAFLKRPTKRRRSETSRTDDSDNVPGSAGQGMKRQLSRPGGVPQNGIPYSEDGVPISGKQGGVDSHHQTPPSSLSNCHSLQSASARISRRGSGTMGRRPPANTSNVLGQRQANVRTYGSQRAAEEPSTGNGYTSSQFAPGSQSQSQSQSRYWSRPKEESQESTTFSQGVRVDEKPVPGLNSCPGL